jgi:hypothetical protein
MLDVIPVVEHQEVIQPAVVTNSASRVFVVALQVTKPKPNNKPWQVNSQQKPWEKHQQRPPQRDHRAKVEWRRLQVTPSTPPFHRAVMREVARSPERLREPEYQRQIAREAGVQRSRPEKRPVDEVVRDRVRVPPHSDRDQRNRGPRQEQSAMR